MNIQARGGFEYFVTFTDDYSKYGYIYLLRRKSECFEKFKEFKIETEKRHDKHIQTLRSDRGGEYLSAEFIKYLSESGITSQYSAPGTPQQNGVAERRNRTLLEMVRSMLSYSYLPFTFWGYALETVNYILNLVPSKFVPLTPSELWNWRKPSLRHIRVWGCPAHVLKGKTDKLESRTEVFIFIGYPKGTKEVITTCSSDYIRSFVLQFMPNGRLENWLYKEDHHLNLHQRVTVMLDAAMAVEYLHHGHVTPIVHCNLKPANVLLDEDMVAHVGDFGISKILAISKFMAYSETLGTLGYIAPEYGSDGIVFASGDVYSYGIMLMEVLTKRRPTDEEICNENLDLRKWITQSFSGSMMDVVDANLSPRKNRSLQKVKSALRP
ncbi:probable receptor-like protein kinase At3g17420 [Solanum tuberosum]|nr:PREDICTED: probable receptor-like protein kinase At3g17420 [Solanum tuberosum]